MLRDRHGWKSPAKRGTDIAVPSDELAFEEAVANELLKSAKARWLGSIPTEEGIVPDQAGASAGSVS